MAIFQAIADVIGTGVNAITAKQNTDNTIQANKNMAEYQYNKDVEMWNKQNEYNSPVNQMARFKQAGLNPNLIYGQGSSGNATQLPKYSAPTAQYNYKPPIDPSSALRAYQDFDLRQAQINNVKAMTDNTNQRTVTEVANSLYKRLLGQKLGAGSDWWIDNAMKENLIKGGQIDLLNKKRQLTGYQADASRIKNKYLDQLFIKQLASADSIISRNTGSTHLMGAQTDLRKKELDTYNLGLAGKVAPGLANILRVIFGK